MLNFQLINYRTERLANETHIVYTCNSFVSEKCCNKETQPIMERLCHRRGQGSGTGIGGEQDPQRPGYIQ